MPDAYKCQHCGTVVERPRNCPDCGENTMRPVRVPDAESTASETGAESAPEPSDREAITDNRESGDGDDGTGTDRGSSGSGGGLLAWLKSLF